MQPENVSWTKSDLYTQYFDHLLIDECLYRSTVRTKRIKEARDEAKSDIADYKSKKEDEYKKFEAEVRCPLYL